MEKAASETRKEGQSFWAELAVTTSQQTAVTPNFITRAINSGELKVPASLVESERERR